MTVTNGLSCANVQSSCRNHLKINLGTLNALPPMMPSGFTVFSGVEGILNLQTAQAA